MRVDSFARVVPLGRKAEVELDRIVKAARESIPYVPPEGIYWVASEYLGESSLVAADTHREAAYKIAKNSGLHFKEGDIVSVTVGIPVVTEIGRIKIEDEKTFDLVF